MKASRAIFAAWITAYAGSLFALDETQRVYRCERQGKVEYTENPCLGAKEIDVTPTKGMDTYKGTAVTPQLQRERTREGFIEALKPATGIGLKEFNAFERRQKIPPAAQQECSALDTYLPKLENNDSTAQGNDKKEQAAAALFAARTRYKALKC